MHSNDLFMNHQTKKDEIGVTESIFEEMLIDGSINNPSDEDNPLTSFPNKF